MESDAVRASTLRVAATITNDPECFAKINDPSRIGSGAMAPDMYFVAGVRAGDPTRNQSLGVQMNISYLKIFCGVTNGAGTKRFCDCQARASGGDGMEAHSACLAWQHHPSPCLLPRHPPQCIFQQCRIRTVGSINVVEDKGSSPAISTCSKLGASGGHVIVVCGADATCATAATDASFEAGGPSRKEGVRRWRWEVGVDGTELVWK